MSDEKINLKDIHNSYWRCRDFELSNLWQRSVFLTAFLVLCFTAYGLVLSKIPDNLSSNYDTLYLVLNGISFCISMVGIIFSILWIKMAKGSKAWYERYECAIRAFEKNTDFVSESVAMYGGFDYVNLPNYKAKPINNGLFNKSAGAYSVSKINIAIGQIFLVIWFLIGLGHTILISFEFINDQKLTTWGVIILITGIALLISTKIIIGRPEMFKSSTIG